MVDEKSDLCNAVLHQDLKSHNQISIEGHSFFFFFCEKELPHKYLFSIFMPKNTKISNWESKYLFATQNIPL